MKYILAFEKFDITKENPSLEVGSDMKAFNDSEQWIKDFNSRKANLAGIYKNYKEDANPSENTPVDLYNKLLASKFIKPDNNKSKIVFLNPLFNVYSEFCRKSRELTNVTTALQQKQQNIGNVQQAVSQNQGDQETSNKDLEYAKTEIQNLTTKLNQLKKEIADLQKSSSTELQNNIKNLEASKKRITNLDNSK